MIGHKLAIGALSAGLLIGGWSITTESAAPSSSSTSPVPAVASAAPVDQPVAGLAPIDEVVALWQERVDTQPFDYLSRTQLGAAFSQRGRERADLDDHERAEAAHRDALRLNPSHTAARLGLAQALVAQHRFEEGRVLASQLLAEEPSSLAAMALLGDTHLELGDYDEASMLYSGLVEREPSAAATSRLARLASIQTTPIEAVGLAEEALTLSRTEGLRPNQQAFYRYQVGHYRFEAGDTDGAIAAFDAALDLDPAHPAATEELAHTLAATGEADRALALYDRMVTDGPAPDLHGRYAELLAATGQEAAAAEQEALGEALAAETLDRYPAERRHLVEFHLGRDPETAVALSERDLDERADVGAYDTLAWALFHAGRIEEAAVAIDQALAQGTQAAPLRYHAAAIAAAARDRAEALAHLEVALTLNPRFDVFDGPAALALYTELAGKPFGT
ncbi:MAG: tetratricopeptide repeat protein [Acidimicrobiales bacterium]